ncbi:MAG: DUF2271 domain-containing protein [Paludibacter sp.]
MNKLILPIFALFFSTTMFAQTAGTLTFKVTTLAGGTISGAHIQVIWIKNSAGSFVKTLLAYSNSKGNIDHLTKWAPGGTTPSIVDALTGATTSTYGTLTETWNATNVSKTVVADGNYTVWVELSDDPSEVSSSWTFAKGATAINSTGTATANFTNVSIVWAPVNTSLNDVELEKLYSVYPNPAISSIFISGVDINEVEICSITGKSLLYSKEQKIDISLLPSGIYLAVIRTKTGTIIKKIQKR